MAALVESGLKNLNFGDADEVGFFQMRVSIWDRGEYAGYPQNPELQLKWFIDTAIQVRDRAVAAGETSYGADPSRWGEWAADVQTPAEQDRHRYQLELDHARELIGELCTNPEPPVPPTPIPPTEATCRGRPATHVGTDEPDVIAATNAADVIVALGGKDVVRALGGNDIVCGGPGDDRLAGGGGRDHLLGNGGADGLRGGGGVDRLDGGPGRDTEKQ